MDGRGDYHTKWSRSERERQTPYDYHLYVRSKIWRKWTFLLNRLTDREKTCGCWGWWEGWTWRVGLAGANHYITEWLNNKALLQSTGNYSQYPGINHSGKETKWKRKCVCVYIYVCICMYNWMCIHIYIYTHTHTHTHMYNWITLLYNGNQHNIENRLYLNFLKF